MTDFSFPTQKAVISDAMNNVPGHLLSTGHLLSRGFPGAKDGRRRLFSQQTNISAVDIPHYRSFDAVDLAVARICIGTKRERLLRNEAEKAAKARRKQEREIKAAQKAVDVREKKAEIARKRAASRASTATPTNRIYKPKRVSQLAMERRWQQVSRPRGLADSIE